MLLRYTLGSSWHGGLPIQRYLVKAYIVRPSAEDTLGVGAGRLDKMRVHTFDFEKGLRWEFGDVEAERLFFSTSRSMLTANADSKRRRAHVGRNTPTDASRAETFPTRSRLSAIAVGVRRKDH